MLLYPTTAPPSDDMLVARNCTFLQSMLPDCPIPRALFKELVYEDIQHQQLTKPTSRLVGACVHTLSSHHPSLLRDSPFAS